MVAKIFQAHTDFFWTSLPILWAELSDALEPVVLPQLGFRHLLHAVGSFCELTKLGVRLFPKY